MSERRQRNDRDFRLGRCRQMRERGTGLAQLVGRLLLLLERRFRFRPPALFALYVAYYSLFRFFIELLRIDPAHHIAGLRINAWVSIVLFALSWGFFVWWQFFRTDSTSVEEQEPPSPPGPEEKKKPKQAKKPTVKVKGPRMTVPKGRVRPGR